jgi:glucokinase
MPSTPSWLLADIGGTNARFGLQLGIGAKIEHVRTLPVAQFPDLASAVVSYLGTMSAELGTDYFPPTQAAFAVATATGADQIHFTNSHWSFSTSKVKAELGLQDLLILNDFEALALSLPRLSLSQIKAHSELPKTDGILAVVGPGTGLGVGGVMKTPMGWFPIPCEGGHATISVTNDFEVQILKVVQRTYPHVSGERLLSGVGLPVLYSAISEVTGHGAHSLTPAEILERGQNGSDQVASQTIDAFCALLGSFAGNVALTMGSRSGLYIGGGIVPRLGDRFFTSAFRERFEAKGRLQGYLAAIPTAVITDTLAALSGAALAIEQHNAFGVK